MTTYISGIVEGPVDEVCLRRLLDYVGATAGIVRVKQGKNNLLDELRKYNQAANYSQWVALIDLDRDFACAVDAKRKWLPHPARYMCFRIVVRAIECWLMADREAIARFLSVSIAKVSKTPEQFDDPKQELINLARQSSNIKTQKAMVPRPGARVGGLYTAYMIRYIQNHWRPDVALDNADSLRRTVRCLRQLLEPAE